jgi:thiosulfate/3-mercaptopyruvate sulfurtransferase
MTDKQILIVADQLHDMLHDPELAIIDCRFVLTDPSAGRSDYEQQHIPGALFLDLDKDLAGPVRPDTGRHPLPDVDAITAKLGALGIDNASRVVVYDGDNAALAARAWWLLRWLGHDAVQVLDGGFAEWRRRAYPIASGTTTRSPAIFEARVRDELVLGTPEIERRLDDAAALRLVDVRDAARFRGEDEPIDPVAGHVPGSLNLPFSRFLRADGTWRPANDRAAMLESVLGKERNLSWSVMCGSGVTACHLVISGLEAGYREPRVYVGSWSEWIRDAARPVALGDD